MERSMFKAIALMYGVILLSCGTDGTSIPRDKEGKPLSLQCDFGPAGKETIILSDCSLPFDQYTRDYTFAVDVLSKATVKLGAPPKQLIDLSENAQQLIINQSSLCRDRNSCVYSRNEYIKIKQTYDLAFAKLKSAADKINNQVSQKKSPPVLGPSDQPTYDIPPDVDEFNSLAASIIKMRTMR
jgi:hypothetical protein